MLSALDCDPCGLDRCLRTQSMLFRQHDARLVHRYCVLCVYSDNLPHQSLRGSFMAKLSRFTRRASAEARSAAKRSRDSISESAPTLLGHAHRTPDSAPPARKSARATATVMSAAGASIDAPALTQDPLLHIPDSSVPLALADGPVSPGLPRPTLKISLPLSKSVVSAPGPSPAPVESEFSSSAWVPHVDPHL